MSATKTHWKKLTNPDYLGAYSLDNGNGGYSDLYATIAYVKVENVIGTDGKREECTVAHFKERDLKPMILNTTNMKTLEKLFKTPYIEDWANCRIWIYVESVKAFGEVVDALRIKKQVPPEPSAAKTVPPCSDCGKEIKAFDDKHDAAYMAGYTQKHYGKPLCAECAKRRAEQEKQTQVADPLATEVIE